MTVLASVLTAAVVGVALTHLFGRRSAPHVIRRSNPRDRFGLDVTRSQFWLSSIGAGFAAFGLVFSITGLAVVSVVPALVVAMLPKTYYTRKKLQRVAEVQEAWPDGLRDLVSAVRSGSSLPSALEDLGKFGPLPLRDVFGSFGVYSKSLGVSPALEMIRSDLADPTSDRVIEVLILAHQRGGVVVPEILADLAVATTRDVWTLEQVRGEALEQKINSRVVFVLPWLVLVVMTMRSGAYREFYSTPIGVFVVVVCGLMSLIGMAVAGRIGSQPGEPRVFVGPRI
ncbi:MAG: type II secretion system F family protein [Acidimicrobiia bacterium]